MKYKLLKDLPFAKAGEVFERVTYKSKDGLSDYDYFKTSKREKDGEDEVLFTIDYNYFLDNFDEWFEKIEEPTTSVRLTPEEAAEARDRRLAKVRLEQTSNFEPDPNNGELGWIVGYSCRAKKLAVERFMYSYYGETIHFKTAEDAKKSIKEHEADWKKYLGIKEN